MRIWKAEFAERRELGGTPVHGIEFRTEEATEEGFSNTKRTNPLSAVRQLNGPGLCPDGLNPGSAAVRVLYSAILAIAPHEGMEAEKSSPAMSLHRRLSGDKRKWSDIHRVSRRGRELTPSLVPRLRYTACEGGRRHVPIGRVCGGGGLADNELTGRHTRSDDLEESCLWPGRGRRRNEARASSVLGRALCGRCQSQVTSRAHHGVLTVVELHVVLDVNERDAEPKQDLNAYPINQAADLLMNPEVAAARVMIGSEPMRDLRQRPQTSATRVNMYHGATAA